MEVWQLNRRRRHDPVQALDVDCQRADEGGAKNARESEYLANYAANWGKNLRLTKG